MAWNTDPREIASELRDEVSSLRSELALMQRKLKRGGRAGWKTAEDQGAEFYDELRDWFSDALPVMRKQAKSAGKVARDNSGMIVAGAVVVGLLALLVSSRR